MMQESLPNISDIFELGPMRTGESQLVQMSKPIVDKLRPVPELVDSRGYYGIEVEVERIRTTEGIDKNFWNIGEDGSLRNNGMEFTTKPVRNINLIYAVENMSEYLKNTPHEFSSRCGLHIHMNCRKMSPVHLRNLIKLYLIFENTIYRVAGGDRKENAFCVPIIGSTMMPSLMIAEALVEKGSEYVSYLRNGWKKYTGMNLLPLAELGTVEFRLMPGGFDKRTIYKWLNILGAMRRAAFRTDPVELQERIENINSDSKYDAFALSIFGDVYYSVAGDLQGELEAGVLANKIIYAGNDPAFLNSDVNVFRKSNLGGLMESLNLIKPVRAFKSVGEKLLIEGGWNV